MYLLIRIVEATPQSIAQYFLIAFENHGISCISRSRHQYDEHLDYSFVMMSAKSKEFFLKLCHVWKPHMLQLFPPSLSDFENIDIP